MKAIVNADLNWGIGKEGQLLFHIPEDMRFFRKKTIGQIIVMGRATLESFPGGLPLPGRTNLVLTSRPHCTPGGCSPCGTLQELQTALAGLDPQQEVYLVGGQIVYEQLIDACDEAFVTRVQSVKEADAFFPNLDIRPHWTLSETSPLLWHDGISFTFCTYKNSLPQNCMAE